MACEKPHPTLKGIATPDHAKRDLVLLTPCEKPHPTLKGIATTTLPRLSVAAATGEKPHPTLKGIATPRPGRRREPCGDTREKPHPTLKGIATFLTSDHLP